MPTLVIQAVRRFRRRLVLATFVRGASTTCFVASAALVAGLVVGGIGEVFEVSALSPWILWGCVAAVSLVGGLALVFKTSFGDAVIVQHLEQRLVTQGLLLAASQGVVLEPVFERRLAQRLADVASVLPSIRWGHLAARPVAAVLLVVMAQHWLPEAARPGASEALDLAVERLAKEVQEIAEIKTVPDDRLDELREAVADLQERAETADHRMWREIDQLQDRIDREELLASGSNGVADDLGAKAAAGGGEVDGAKLMAALEELRQLDDEVVGRLMEHLPEDLDAELKQMLADAAAPDGRFDLDALPEDAATQAALADAVAEALEGMRSELGSEMSEQLAELALEMAKSGGLQQLPDALREAMLEAGLSALEEMDLEQLRSMMPEDLAQLSELAKGLAEAAKGLDLGEGGGQLSAESREKMAALADGLLKQMSNRQIGQWQQLMQQAQVAAGQAGQSNGLGTDNGGHAALRLTGGSRGDAAASDLVLPGRRPSELASEWVPVMIGKAKPETGQKRAAGVGRAGATGSGGAAWQLRLRPRHRDVVRRFFAEKNK